MKIILFQESNVYLPSWRFAVNKFNKYFIDEASKLGKIDFKQPKCNRNICLPLKEAQFKCVEDYDEFVITVRNAYRV